MKKGDKLTLKEFEDYFILNKQNISQAQLVGECLNYNKNSVLPKYFKTK